MADLVDPAHPPLIASLRVKLRRRGAELLADPALLATASASRTATATKPINRATLTYATSTGNGLKAGKGR